jgi:hypothetical protein
MEQAGVWGNVAASFLGAAAGVAVSSSLGHSHDGCSSYDSCSSPDSVDTYDDSDVSDDTGFDFGGDD